MGGQGLDWGQDFLLQTGYAMIGWQDYTCQPFLMQRHEIFIRIWWNHSAHLRKCLKTFRKFTKTIRTFPKILWSSSKTRESSLEELSFMCTFQSIIALRTNYMFTYYQGHSVHIRTYARAYLKNLKRYLFFICLCIALLAQSDSSNALAFYSRYCCYLA